MTPKPGQPAYADLVIVLALLGLAGLCYAYALDAEFLHSWDDNHYVTKNTRIRDLGPAGLWAMWSQPHYWHYIPMTLMSYALDYRFWELNPFGYRLTNLLLHALNGILAYLLCLRLQDSRAAAAIAAVLFIIHPLQVESVAWISERKNVLSLTFFLLAFTAHIRSRQAQPAFWSWAQGLAQGLFLLAILSKSIVAFTPLLFIAYDLSWARRDFRSSLLPNLPYLVIGAGGAIGTILAHQGNANIVDYWSNSFWLTATLMLRVTWEYLISLILPLHLDNLYIYTIDMIQGEVRVWAGAGILILVALLAWRQPLGRPLSRFTVLWCITLMLPVANLFPFGFQRADRYLYHPSVLLFLLAGIAAVCGYRHFSHTHTRAIWVGVIGLVMAALVFLTVQRSTVWMTSETLWKTHLQHNPQSPTGLLNLGVYYYNQKDYENGYHQLSESIRLNPHRRRAHYYLGRCAFESGRREEALHIYHEATQRWPQNRNLHNGFGYVAYQLKHYQAALNAYRRVYAINPEDRDVRLHITNIGRAALQDQNYSMARQAFAYLQQIESGHPDATGGLCQSLVGLKQMSEALPWCRQVVQSSPNDARYLTQLALVLLRLDQLDEALPRVQRAIKRSPKWAFAYRLLGDIYCAMGNLPKAASAYQKALALEPESAALQKRLQNLGACQK